MRQFKCARRSRSRREHNHKLQGWIAKEINLLKVCTSYPNRRPSDQKNVLIFYAQGEWHFRFLILSRTTAPRDRCGRASQQSFGAQVLVDIGPMNSVAAASNFPILALRGCGVEQSRIPDERHTDDAAVRAGYADGGVGELDVQHALIRDFHHPILLFPATQSKCRSRLSSGNECWRQRAAIQMSLVGIGLPLRFSSRVISA